MKRITLNLQGNSINSNILSPTLASFFHGVGGMSKGAQRAGFNTVYATDCWDAAENAFKINNCSGYFDNCDFSLNRMNFRRIKKLVDRHFNGALKLEKGMIDCVVSGSPCPGMSGVNPLRSNFDVRNLLMMKQIRLAGMQGLNAKTAWFEQVPGFFDKPMKALRMEVLATLEAQTDYYYDIRVLNALDYGSYQSRNRVTIIMVRKDVGEPSFPETTPVYLSEVSMQAVLPYIIAFKYGVYGTPKAAGRNVINTMTANDEGLMVLDKFGWRKISVQERKILSHLDGYDISNFPEKDQIRLMGNMVQIPFAEAILRHLKDEILQYRSATNITLSDTLKMAA